MSDTYEYRIVDRDGLDYEDGKGSDLTIVQNRAERWDARYRESSPFRVERRLIGAWEPVEEEQ